MRFLLLVALAAPVAAQSRYEFTELHFGMATRVVLYAPDESAARSAARSAFDRIAALEDKMSDWRPGSEVRRLEGRAGEWTEVSAELYAVLWRAVEIAALTDGAYDPTVAPLVALWREARRTGALPSAATLDSTRALVGWRRVSLDKCRPLVRLEPGTRLDLGGIAKGYIVAEALMALRGRGISSALVEAGGDVVTGDPPPDRPGWSITAAGSDSVYANVAVSTSGTGEQFVEVGDVRYAHVVDPRTGLGITAPRTVTVIAADAATADALATALVVLGPERGDAVAARFPGVAVR
jgi:thiamine biosynthesis lipoprotein